LRWPREGRIRTAGDGLGRTGDRIVSAGDSITRDGLPSRGAVEASGAAVEAPAAPMGASAVPTEASAAPTEASAAPAEASGAPEPRFCRRRPDSPRTPRHRPRPWTLHPLRRRHRAQRRPVLDRRWSRAARTDGHRPRRRRDFAGAVAIVAGRNRIEAIGNRNASGGVGWRSAGDRIGSAGDRIRRDRS
jgi:hypothetical protein